MDTGIPHAPDGMVTITLREPEYHFLLTVLRSSGNILKAMAELQKTLPDVIDLPITPEIVQDIGVLADRIEHVAIHQAGETGSN